jgi:hypothetical protein
VRRQRATAHERAFGYTRAVSRDLRPSTPSFMRLRLALLAAAYSLLAIAPHILRPVGWLLAAAAVLAPPLRPARRRRQP